MTSGCYVTDPSSLRSSGHGAGAFAPAPNYQLAGGGLRIRKQRVWLPYIVAAVYLGGVLGWEQPLWGFEYRSGRELARGEASIVDPLPLDAVFTNPAAVPEQEFHSFDLQLAVNENMQALNKTITAFRRHNGDVPAQIDILDSVFNKPLFGELDLSWVTILPKDFAFMLLSQSSFSGLISGKVLPYVDTNLQQKLSFLASLRHFFPEAGLSLGLTLKPSYLLSNQVDADLLAVAEQGATLFSMRKAGREGVGVGIDMGVRWQRSLTTGKVSLGATLRNIGDLQYHHRRVLASNALAGPTVEPSLALLGAGWSWFTNLPVLEKIDTFYAYEPGVTRGLSPHRLGVSVPISRYGQVSLGKYRDSLSGGLGIQLEGFTVHCTVYREPLGDEGAPAYDKRLLVQMGYIF